MGSERKTIGEHAGEVAGAAIDVEGLAAVVALKVVVVSLAGELVARGFAGEFDGDDLAAFFEGTDRSINGCDTDGWDDFGCPLQDFLGAERVGVVLEE